MKKKKINRLFLLAHPFYLFASAGKDKYPLKEKELEKAIMRLGKKMKGMVNGIAKNPNTLLVVVRTDFVHTRDRPAPGAVKAHSLLLNHCKKVLGNRAKILHPKAGFSVGKEKDAVKLFKNAFKEFSFSKDLKVFRTGEIRGENYCVERANRRAVKAIREVFGIRVPKERQQKIPALLFDKKSLQDRMWREKEKLAKPRKSKKSRQHKKLP